MTEQIEEIISGIYRIPVPLKGNPLRELNSYVIKGQSGKNLLIDTGFRTEECRQALLDGLAYLDISMENTDILLTHLHADHAGNAPDMVCAGCRVYMSRRDTACVVGRTEEHGVSSLHRSRSERFLRNGISQTLLGEMLRTTPSKTMAPDVGFKDYTPLDEGDVLEAGDYRLKAIYTPGHTPGHMCFEILGTGAMILGDHVLFDITPNITDWEGVEDSLGDYLESLDKIGGYDVSIPLAGHRQSGDFHQRISQLKAHHAARLEECRNVIHKLGKAQLYDIAGNMTWKIRAAGWDDFPSAQRWFALGETLSHIDHLKKMGQLTEHKEEGIFWYEA